ncbi:hypothetical protein [Thalassobacillus sp. CUG 92003]|uniref:hypothetical protein n=1 Tax=Thalassobacillus sp. CUG 92003 TaxID=2736641 RepID=UPI0015E7349F|nr:hypothetical protein [Thalassobacillus sp. CUG 92003]
MKKSKVKQALQQDIMKHEEVRDFIVMKATDKKVILKVFHVNGQWFTSQYKVVEDTLVFDKHLKMFLN